MGTFAEKPNDDECNMNILHYTSYKLNFLLCKLFTRVLYIFTGYMSRIRFILSLAVRMSAQAQAVAS